jgi:hypothetical protein
MEIAVTETRTRALRLAPSGKLMAMISLSFTLNPPKRLQKRLLFMGKLLTAVEPDPHPSSTRPCTLYRKL